LTHSLLGSVLFGADEVVAEFVKQRVSNTSFSQFTALGVVRNNRLVAGVVYHRFRQIDIEVVIAADTANWCFPATMRTLFAYPFGQLGVQRISAVVGRKNKMSRKLVKGLGFKEEGCCRKALDNGEDAFIYGILREECKFIRKSDGR
jgi:RimJ/RimL family protein N-acetyltransferase